MRAMILAAGLGTRMRPLSTLRPKPAMPVRGLPLVAYNLALLARHGVREVVINLHPLPDVLEEASRRHAPPGMQLRFSREARLLDTGGGIRRVADFLRESDPCLLLGGDMILDADLSALVALHRERSDRVTMLLCRDPRAGRFGTLGTDPEGRVRRIARHLDLGGETDQGVWVWANVVASRFFDDMPDREVSVFLHDWIGSALSRGADDVRAVVQDTAACRWEPVGTLPEYLAANLDPPALSYLDPDARAAAEGTRFAPGLVIGAGAVIEPGARLERAVVWDGEFVPSRTRGREGVYAGGSFHACGLVPPSPGTASTVQPCQGES